MMPMPPIDSTPQPTCQANCPPHIAKTMERIEQNQVELLKTAAKHGQWLESIDRRLATLNGTVARHEQRLQDLELAQAAEAAAEKATEKANGVWLKWVKPASQSALKGVLWLAALFAIFHVQELKEFLGLIKK